MNCSTFGKICLAATIPLCLSASIVQAAGLETITIKKQTSQYMDMGQQIKRIAIGNSEIASIIQLPDSASEFLIVTKNTIGSTSLFVWTLDNVRHEYLIAVSPEDPGQAVLIERAINLPDVHVKMVGERILLTGTVENQYQKNYALQTARLFVNASTESSLLVGSGFDMDLKVESATSKGGGSGDVSESESKGKIIDLLQILHPTQIRLEAQIIEINSDKASELGLRYGDGESGGIFYFGESYARTNTYTSESFSDSGSTSYSGGDSNSYSGSRSDSYSYSSTNDAGATNSNSYSNSYSNGNSGGFSNSLSSAFSRSVSSNWYDMVRFANNPLKWVGQHFSPINVTLQALVTKGNGKVLSRPSVMTLSGEQATIQIGGKIPYTSTNTNGGSNTQFEDYGIILQFKPVVDAQHRINSAIHTEVSSLSSRAVNGQPIIATRRADSVISLNSGEPIVIGGLMDSSESKNIEKIPLLGDIPIIGEFFKHTSKSRNKQELIIVVTPYLVGEDDRSQTPMSTAMMEWLYMEQQYRNAMNNFDFARPNFDAVDKEKIKQAKKAKTTNEPFK